MMIAARIAAALALAALPMELAGQDVGTVVVEVGAEPSRVTVGDPFTAAVRVRAPAGVRVEYGPIESGDTLQAVGPPRPLAADGGTEGAAYPLVAWVAGVPLAASVPVRLVEPSGAARVHLVRLRLPQVVSVLPADAGGEVAPRPAKPLFRLAGPPAILPWWYWLAALVGALLVAGLAIRRLRSEDAPDALMPRDWALRHLAEIPDASTPEDAARGYRRGAWVLRAYLARIDARFGADLTSTELLARLAADGFDPAGLREIGSLLASADHAKFSGREHRADAARSWLAGLRSWIAAYPPAAPGEPPRRAA